MKIVHDRVVILFNDGTSHAIDYCEKERRRFPTFEQFVENYRVGWNIPVKYVVQRIPPVGSPHWKQAD